MKAVLQEIFKVLLAVAVPLASFSTGLGAPRGGPQALWRQPRQLGLALLAALVLVPLWAVLFLKALPLEPATRGGVILAVLAVGIGPIAGMKRLQGDSPAVRRAFELNVLILALSIVYIPLMVSVLARVFQRDDVALGVSQVAKIVLIKALIPLTIGVLAARLVPRVARVARRPLAITVNVAVIAILVLAVVALWRQLAQVGVEGWLVCFAVAVGAAVIGHLLGGPTAETRAPLARACTMRFPALALMLATIVPNGGPRLQAVVLGYVLAAVVVVGVYGRVVAARAKRPARPRRGAGVIQRPATPFG